MYYHLSLWTGLRVDEVRNLEWRDVELDGNRPAICFRLGTTKSRRADVVPLHPSLVRALRDAKPVGAGPKDRVFASVPLLRTFKLDLERGGIACEDDQGRTLDRHAMRTTLETWLSAAGVPRDHIDAILRHKPRDVGRKHYLDYRYLDLWAEIRRLPGTEDLAGGEEIRATGTCDILPGAVVRPVVLRSVREGVDVSYPGRLVSEGGTGAEAGKAYNNSVFDPLRDYRRLGSNQGPPAPQAGALTN